MHELLPTYFFLYSSFLGLFFGSNDRLYDGEKRDISQTAFIQAGFIEPYSEKQLSVVFGYIDNYHPVGTQGGFVLPGWHVLKFQIYSPNGSTNDGWHSQRIFVEAGKRYDIVPTYRRCKYEAQMPGFSTAQGRLSNGCSSSLTMIERPLVDGHPEMLKHQVFTTLVDDRHTWIVAAEGQRTAYDIETERTSREAEQKLIFENRQKQNIYKVAQKNSEDQVLVKKLGAKICNISYRGDSKSVIIAFTERIESSRIQIRISGFNNALSESAYYEGMNIRPGSIIWDDSINWQACD